MRVSNLATAILCICLFSKAGYCQDFAAIANSERSYINAQGKVMRESGFIGTGETLEEAKEDAIKNCRKGTTDYNGKNA